MKTNDENDLISVYSSTFMEVHMIKSMLESSGVETFIKDEYMGTLAPFDAAAGGAGAVQLITRRKDYDAARRVIEEYEANKKSD
jgi:hypothetical protein